MNKVELLHWALGAVGTATIALLILPTPDKFAELFLLQQAPRSYVVFYNLIRYLANLNYRAGWQASRSGGSDAATPGQK